MPSKISELALKTLVGTDQIPVSADGSSNSNRVLASDFLPITESVTKTVAADGMPAGVQDFDTFHEAMTWACSQMIQGTFLKLLLEDGTHYTGNADALNTEWSCLYPITNGNHIFVEGASADKSLCTLTIPSDFSDWKRVFIPRIGYLALMYLTCDMSIGGYLTPETIIPIETRYQGNFYTYGCSFENAYVGVNLVNKSYASIYDIEIIGCVKGLNVASNSYCLLGSADFTNCGTGVSVTSTAILDVSDFNHVAFNGNTTDINISINEIQSDGSYITDGTVPLTIAESYGTTAERPDPVQDGFNYFDSTLGKPIWYDGTNWVDATGATV